MNIIRRLWQKAMRNKALREKLRVIIFQSDTPLGKAFDITLLWCIVASILLVVVESMRGLPPMAKQIFTILEYVFTFFFTLEYLCRLYCSDKPKEYALSFFGIVDLLSTLPLYIGWLFGPVRYLMVVRTFRLIRVFRVFKLFSFLQEGDLLMRSIIISAPKIGVFFLFMVILVISMGTLMFMVEGNLPGSPFKDIPTSIYWAVVTMTTVGYGDIAPATFFGRVLSAIVMLMGYTIMAVPTGIVSAQMVHDHKTRRKDKFCPECGSPLPFDAHYCPFCGLKQDAIKNLKSVKAPLVLILCLLMPSVPLFAEGQRLTGTIIGTAESVDYATGQASTTINTAANAFDGNLSTFFASYERSKTWVGLDLGTKHVITRVGWAPREGSYGPKRVVLGLFEGANDPSFMDGVPLYIIDEEGTVGTMSYADVDVSRGFRYVRYIGPNDARCNIAEVAFYGQASEGDDSHFYQLTNLPTLSFHTVDNVDPYDKVHEIVSSITIIYDNETKIQEETGTTRYRGNGSLTNEKKPYRIKLDESRRMFKNSEMRSPAKARKWTLINNHDDKTLMRNLVAFEIARRMGYDYVPWSKPVDVIVNGEYKGCYQLSDQITVDRNRVNITEMLPTDIEGDLITGGYLLELDGYANQEVSWFTSAAGNPVTIKSPDDNDIVPEQAAYIRREFNLMEAKILASNFDDPDLGFRSKLDEKTLLQYFLTEELAGNPDAFWSCYLTKDREEDVFRIGPVWDFDNAFDNDYRNYPTNGLGDFLSLARGGAGNSRALLKRMFSDQVLRDSMAVMWNNARAERGITAESLDAYIDSTANELMQSQRLNFIRWPILDKLIQINHRAGGSYEVEVGWLKEYIDERIPWLDNAINTESDDQEPELVEIASATALARFANRVNNGETKLNAVLKADINFAPYPSIMIGVNTHYQGEFDGAGHSIKLALKRTSDDAGLFGWLSGYVHDLTTTGTITTSAKFAGGIAARTEDATIERCQSRVNIVSTVNGDGTHGGIMGIAYKGTIVRDCLVSGNMEGNQTNCCGGVAGWTDGSTHISNCLITSQFTVGTSGSDLLARNVSNVTSTNNYFASNWSASNGCGGITFLTENQVAYGEACFMLDGKQPGSTAWRQTLGSDVTPVPDTSHGTVYCFSHLHCDGTPYTTINGYTNDASRNGQDEHSFQYGICQYCGHVDMDSMPKDERGYFQIASAEALGWFAQMIEQGHTDICGVLTEDIDFTGYPTTMIGDSKTYEGTFDGAGHTITIALVRTADYAGLFNRLSGTVQDLIVRGTITTNRKFAGLAANVLGGTLLRCQSYIDINATINGDGTHGGLAGLLSDGPDISKIQDCIFAGSINGDNVNLCGGLVGWASSLGIISNSLMLGKMNISSEGGDIICRNNRSAIILDTYYHIDWNISEPTDAVSTDWYDMACGKLCYQLNAGRSEERQAWFQTLSKDSYPVPDNRHLPVWKYDNAYYNESPDGIDEMKDDELKGFSSTKSKKNNGATYDLSGRIIVNGQLPRGIYIIDGHKVVIK